MALNQDARPFVDLKKDAEEFEAKFKEDIEECLTFLDAKITALIRDPDSLEDKVKNVKNNALLEFSKAKYEIFMNVKSLIITKEREWLSYISEMKKLFIENVEIFLAGTKLEVKLPPPEYHSSSGSRKSPGNRKSISSVTGSIYPFVSSVTKNISVLSSPLRKEGTGEDNSKVVKESQSNRGDRLSAKFNIAPGTNATISLSGKGESSDNSEDESKAVRDKVQFNRRSRLSVKLNKPPRVAASLSQKDSTTDSSESEAGTVVENVQLGRRGRRPAASIKLSKSTIQTRKETSDIEMDTEEVAQEPEDAEMDTDEADLGIQDKMTSQIQQDITVSKSVRGRRGKQLVQNGKLDDAADPLPSKKLPSRSSKLRETENGETVETSVAASKGRRGKAKSRNADVFVADIFNSLESNHCSVENGESVEISVAASKSRRGKAKSRNAANAKARNAVNNSLANQVAEDANSVDKEEKTVEVVSGKGRRGRSKVPKASDNIYISDDKVAEDVNPVDEKPPNMKAVSNKNRRGQSAPPKGSHGNVSESEVEENINSDKEPTVEIMNGRSYRSRSAAPKASDKIISTRKPVRGRKSIRVVDETPELALSETSSDEQYDEDVPPYVARSAKPSARRKTLLPTSVDVPGFDIIPGHSTRTSSKRKTIGGVSALETAAPSKRLKVSSKKDLSSIQEDAAANDNLLGSDDDYSEWMTLKSLDGKIPTLPAIYEVKVWRAKKTAYIGSCESLRQKLTLYKLRQNSGHKHLDKFVERNFNDIQVRFEVVSSAEDAKNKVKSRVKQFVDQYKTTPAYN